MNIVGRCLHLDWCKCFCEEVSSILICGNISQVKIAGPLYVVSQPVISDVDMAGAMLVNGVFEKRDGALVVAEQSDV